MTRMPARYLADRDGDRFAIRLTTHTGLVLGGWSRHQQVSGTFEYCIQAYQRAQRHNVVLGWWSIAFVFNSRALSANKRAATQLCALRLQSLALARAPRN